MTVSIEAAPITSTAEPPPLSARALKRRAPPPPRSWRRRLGEELKRTFGLHHLREGQAAIIERVMQRLPTLGVMPTGAGKSLCFQLPALLLPGTTVVVSPLIALMKDQCDKLGELGIPAVQLHSGMNAAETQAAEAAIAEGRVRLIFTTPERLADAGFQRLVSSRPVSLLVVDEAHCISQWGHDFRPAFLDIGGALSPLGHPTVLGLTATASEQVAGDFARHLSLRDLKVVSTGVYRENLHYRVDMVATEREKLDRARSIVEAVEGTGIVYAATVKAAEEVHAALASAFAERGEPVALYHGKLPSAERQAQQEAWMSGRARVMVATNAFGLGIDKPDTRFVLHYQMPGSLDAYYQESGRAGRDGNDALGVLLYLRRDKAVQQFFLAGRYPELDDMRAVVATLVSPPPPGGGWTMARVQAALDRPRSPVQVALTLLREQRIVRRERDGTLRLADAAVGDDTLQSLVADYRRRREHDREMLERMVFYAQTGHCRWKLLLEHFGEDEGFERCGHCDNCRRLGEAEREIQARRADPPPPTTTAPAPPAEARMPTFRPGAVVRVPRYGEGLVSEADADSVTVAFPGGERRSFLASFVQPA